MTGPVCPLCQSIMQPNRPNSRKQHTTRMSADHVLPRVRGGTHSLPDGVTNTRIMCQSCNSNLASCFHCIATFSCVKAVAEDSGDAFRNIMGRWKIASLGGQLAEAEANALRNALRVEYQRQLSRINADVDHPNVFAIFFAQEGIR